MPGYLPGEARWPAAFGFVAGLISLTALLPTTFALDKVYHTSIAFLLTIATILLLLPRLPLPSSWAPNPVGGANGYTVVPLQDVRGPQSPRASSPSRAHQQESEYPSSVRKLRISFVVLAVLVSWRVEIVRQIVWNVQCTHTSWAALIPFALAILEDRFSASKRSQLPESNEAAQTAPNLVARLFRPVSSSVWISLLLAVAGVMSASATRGPQTTYICATTSSWNRLIPWLQHLGTFLDIVILYCMRLLLQNPESSSTKPSQLPRFTSIAFAAIFAALGLLALGSVYFIASSDDRQDISNVHRMYMYSTFKFNLVLCFTTVCGMLTIHHLGLLTTSMLATAILIFSSSTSFVLAHHSPYPPVDAGTIFLGVLLAAMAFSAYLQRAPSTSKLFSHTPFWLHGMIALIVVINGLLYVSRGTTIPGHPIDEIIQLNKEMHESYVEYATASKTLADAVRIYQETYRRSPPPGFDVWYNYAVNRSSLIIDVFDNIQSDLLPFWALSPAEIRERTYEMISNPWNDNGAISIRAGKATVHDTVAPTHRWMLDGVVEILNNFSEHLPDMDLAFNMNDECRVATPYETIQPMRKTAEDTARVLGNPNSTFTASRDEQWKPIPDPPNSESPLKDNGWHNMFYEFGSVGCAPGSPARTQRRWDVSRLCTSCMAPHSSSAFLRDWDLAHNVCHQPDLAQLHGVYISPSAFKGASDLYPIFSQSKVDGFNDIRYPSAWNYIDKAKYDPSEEHPDPPFAEKNNTLFWRGATSEGGSAGLGQWQGMARQRFIHLTNKFSSPGQLLLSSNFTSTDDTSDYFYQDFPESLLSSVVSADVHVVNEIVRCHPWDCAQQAQEFVLAEPSDFQAHWSYKYLLDLDGAGFSGRFLPFLLSRSLPFKAGMFIEWWSDRVTAWQHFVPLDIRGHGLWATLAYFAGLSAEDMQVKVQGRPEKAEQIATQGKEWAEKVLRKEDMEVYFFRLLLEWGRLTDDDRDNLGFSMQT